MSTQPDSLDLKNSSLSGDDRVEYSRLVELLHEQLAEYWTFEIVPGYFKQSDKDTDDTTYDNNKEHFGRQKGWKEILSDLDELNSSAGADESYKVFFLARHGQGYHNVAHLKYGDEKWNEYWSKLYGDDELVWGPDPELTVLGLQQAAENNHQWKAEVEAGAPIPTKFFSSPFRRSIDTLIGTWKDIVELTDIKPLILEDLRETIGVHTCDMRSTKTIIKNKYESLGFIIENGFQEEDVYWKKDYRESNAEQAIRINRSFQHIFSNTPKEDALVSVTSHSGSIRTQLMVLGHRSFAIGTGGMIPVFVKAKKHRSGH